MQNLIQMAIAMVVVAAVLMIGTGVVEQTFDTVNSSTGGSTTLTNVNTDVGDALETLGGFLPVIIIAGVGAIALGMLLRFGQ